MRAVNLLPTLKELRKITANLMYRFRHRLTPDRIGICLFAHFKKLVAFLTVLGIP